MARYLANLTHITALAAGMYVGYHEKHGIALSQTREYLLLVAPTIAFTSATASLLIMGKYLSEKALESHKNCSTGTIRKAGLFTDATDVRISQLPPEKREQIISNLEKTINAFKIPQSTTKVGLVTAAETALGYAIGRFLL